MRYPERERTEFTPSGSIYTFDHLPNAGHSHVTTTTNGYAVGHVEMPDHYLVFLGRAKSIRVTESLRAWKFPKTEGASIAVHRMCDALCDRINFPNWSGAYRSLLRGGVVPA